MIRRHVPLTVAVLAALCAFAPAGSVLACVDKPAPASGLAPPAGWKLVWADEFELAAVDRKKWAFDLGNRLPGGQPGWGNGELQFYTDRTANAYVRDGALRLRAIREEHEGQPFTSARLKTKGLFAKKYGRFEIRAKLPTGKGVWPAIWMLPEGNAYGSWPASGEIDVVEARGQEPAKVLGTLHYGPPHTHTGKGFTFPDRGTFADFHVYTLEWEPGEIRWYVDGRLYQAQSFWWSSSRRRRGEGRPRAEPGPNAWPAPFDRPFHLLLNVAVGGHFAGNPDAATPFPVEMVVDYVRVYDRPGGYGETKPRGEGTFPPPAGAGRFDQD